MVTSQLPRISCDRFAITAMPVRSTFPERRTIGLCVRPIQFDTRKRVRALERFAAILEAVAENGGDASPKTVSTHTGLSLSSTSRLMRMLADDGFLQRQGKSGAYSLGGRFLAIARSSNDDDGILRQALPLMEALRDSTGETVSLHVAAETLRTMHRRGSEPPVRSTGSSSRLFGRTSYRCYRHRPPGGPV